MASASARTLKFEGCNFLRQRLVLSTLSGRPIRITKIREDADEPGLREFEAGFIRLIDKLTNGSRIEVNVTGTSLVYHPGLLEGGTLEHDCSQQRSIGYFLEPLMMLAPFAKKPIRITLRGSTNGPDDPSVDYYRMCVLPLLKKILPDNELELKLNHRGVWPEGTGEVYFLCPVVRKMRALQMTDDGKARRVRGIAYCVRVSPAMANRMVDSARSVLNKYLPDVYIYTDVVRGKEVGKSPGYGLTLVSESTTGVTHAAELSTHRHASTQSLPSQSHYHTPTHSLPSRSHLTEDAAQPVNKSSPVLPEDIGEQAAISLIEEIVKGGCTDSGCQVLPLLFMALGQKDVSKLNLGQLSTYTIQFLRHMKDFFQLTYKVESTEEDLQGGSGANEEEYEDVDSFSRQVVTLSCVGVGYSNFSKGIM